MMDLNPLIEQLTEHLDNQLAREAARASSPRDRQRVELAHNLLESAMLVDGAKRLMAALAEAEEPLPSRFVKVRAGGGVYRGAVTRNGHVLCVEHVELGPDNKVHRRRVDVHQPQAIEWMSAEWYETLVGRLEERAFKNIDRATAIDNAEFDEQALGRQRMEEACARALERTIHRGALQLVEVGAAAKRAKERRERCGEGCSCTLCEQDLEDEREPGDCPVCGRTDPECQTCRGDR